MKIIRLQSSNVMRLVAVDITPEGHVVMVGGRNGAGKSSVLDSIAMALGGLALAPEEPIRAGESEARIIVDLGDMRVTRRFSRDRVHTPDCGLRLDVESKLCNCQPSWSETRSTLSVTNADGLASYKSPQAMLDKLLGKLTFDPLAFAHDDAKRQDETLRRLVGLDTADADRRRAEAFAERTRLKKHHDAKVAVVASMPFHGDTPDAEIPMAEVSAEMLRAEELRRSAEDAERAAEKAREVAKSERRLLVAHHQQRTQIVETLRQIDDKIAKAEASILTLAKEAEVKQDSAETARAAVPDAGAVRARLAEAEATNARVRANAARRAAQAEADAIKAAVDVQHEAIIRADDEKRLALAGTRFPVEGLGIGDDGVTFGGLPFSQASSSEQLRVSVAIGLALNPTLRVLLVRNGNVMDEDSLAAVAAQAEAADAQLWVEWVTKDAAGVSVMIEEGRVVAQEQIQS